MNTDRNERSIQGFDWERVISTVFFLSLNLEHFVLETLECRKAGSKRSPYCGREVLCLYLV